MTDDVLTDDRLAATVSVLAVDLADAGKRIKAGRFDQSERDTLAEALTAVVAMLRPAEDAKRLETVAMLLHERRHRMGTGQICDTCRDDARAVLAVPIEGR